MNKSWKPPKPTGTAPGYALQKVQREGEPLLSIPEAQRAAGPLQAQPGTAPHESLSTTGTALKPHQREHQPDPLELVTYRKVVRGKSMFRSAARPLDKLNPIDSVQHKCMELQFTPKPTTDEGKVYLNFTTVNRRC